MAGATLTTCRNLLAKSARLVSKEENWCRSDLAVDVKGRPCSPHIKRARRWDAIGALYNSAGVAPSETIDHRGLIEALAHLDYAASLLHKRTIVGVNDDLGHAAVLDCYRAAWLRARRSSLA